MNLIDEKPKTIFRNEKDGKVFYSLRLSKKDKDGNYINGYVSCKFQKDVNLENKSKIILKDAWLDFYIKDRATNVYIFINKFEKVEDIEIPQNTKTEYQQQSIVLEDKDLPF